MSRVVPWWTSRRWSRRCRPADIRDAAPGVPVPEALLGMDNVVLLPHIGSATRETRGAMEDLVLANLQRFLAEGQLVTPV